MLRKLSTAWATVDTAWTDGVKETARGEHIKLAVWSGEESAIGLTSLALAADIMGSACLRL